MKTKILAGITQDNELYFLEINKRDRNNDFSMSAFSVVPITESDGEKEARESLEEGELWRMAVEAKNTYQGFDDWIDEVLEVDGWESVLDTSLYSEVIDFNGENYHFLSQACGQHEENELKHYIINKKDFKAIMGVWKKYHLEPSDKLSSRAKKTVVRVINKYSDNDTVEVLRNAISYIVN